MKIPLPVRAIPRLTFEAWLTPPPLGRGIESRDRESTADLTRVHFGGIAGYETGDGPPVVVLHGWGGRPAQMAPIARHLAHQGHRVLVPELPGHAGGRPTDIKQVAAALLAVIDDVGEPELVVAHSFAAMVLRLAFPDRAPARVALVAPALDVRDALDVFSDRLRLFPWARRGLRTELERWDPALWPLVASVAPSQLPGADVLIIHDPDDRETSFARSAELAALRPGTAIVALEGAGHSRILSNPAALDHLARLQENEAVSDDTAA
jgi:pimeloyl-ACP methyl ester carboxylesterase